MRHRQKGIGVLSCFGVLHLSKSGSCFLAEKIGFGNSFVGKFFNPLPTSPSMRRRSKSTKDLRSKALAPSPFQGEGWGEVLLNTNQIVFRMLVNPTLTLPSMRGGNLLRKALALAPSPCQGEGWDGVFFECESD